VTMGRMKTLDRNVLIEKLLVTKHRLECALDRFYGHDVSGNQVALEAEVLDIALPIRVFVHHVPDKKPPSPCLLHQLDSEYWKRPIHFKPLIAPARGRLPSGEQWMTVSIPVNLSIGASGAAFVRYKRGSDAEAKAPLRDWWLTPCWDSGNNKVSNKDIVLAMANKEGGAHVAADLSAKYEKAKGQGRLSIGEKSISDIARLGSLLGIAGDELLEYLQENFPECA